MFYSRKVTVTVCVYVNHCCYGWFVCGYSVSMEQLKCLDIRGTTCFPYINTLFHNNLICTLELTENRTEKPLPLLSPSKNSECRNMIAEGTQSSLSTKCLLIGEEFVLSQSAQQYCSIKQLCSVSHILLWNMYAWLTWKETLNVWTELHMLLQALFFNVWRSCSTKIMSTFWVVYCNSDKLSS